ncbi:MAG: D-aminoacyl-tRNA deacylase [Bacteroidota bacterium]|nr:D-aminoacyl-tRNA deacylase [Bacteroidota bacterium]
MKAVIQRVKQSSVTVDNKITGQIKHGLNILLGIDIADNDNDIEWLCNKIVNLRIFNDDKGLMNLSVKDVKGDIILISQFTLISDTKKGNRPSFINAAKPDIAIPIYEKFISCLEKSLYKPIQKGIFGADMKVSILNDGPVTIIIDTKNK